MLCLYDFRIVKKNSKTYFVSIPGVKEIKSYPNQQGIVSIDPGVRIPFTLYDSNGKVIKICEGQYNILYKINLRIDSLRSYRDNLKNQKIKFNSLLTKEENELRKKENRKLSSKICRISDLMSRLEDRIKNLVKEIHYFTINYLIKNYNMVLLPKFQTQKMITKQVKKINKDVDDVKTRVINEKTVRSMLAWSHYLFRKRFLDKSKDSGCTLLLVDEDYTTKTCSNCGNIHQKIGSAKVFKCSSCDFVIDRDYNGAVNIMLKFFTKLMSSKDVSLPIDGV